LKGLTPAVVDTMMLARRSSSLRLYDTYTRRWQEYCTLHGLNFISASVAQGLAFLQTLLDSGLGYSTLNTARSALSAVLCLPTGGTFGNHPDVLLYMKGVFNIRPTKPRYMARNSLFTTLASLGFMFTLEIFHVFINSEMYLLCNFVYFYDVVPIIYDQNSI
jgi:hypothetical protein